MNKEDFLNLYVMQEADNAITVFDNEIGFSLIRDYPKNTPYYKDGRKMFIKLAILQGKIFYCHCCNSAYSRYLISNALDEAEFNIVSRYCGARRGPTFRARVDFACLWG